MIQALRFTVLMEHRSALPGLATEHGLALWVEAGGLRILFDTGQGPALVDNARRLGVDLGQADLIVLSHGHYDHTGGLAAALKAAPRARVCLHPEAGRPRFSREPGKPLRFLGMSEDTWRALGPRLPGASLCTGPLELAPGLWASGPIPRALPVEHPQGAFTLDPEGHHRDPFRDDQALILQGASGPVVFTGCGHAGVANTLAWAAALSGDARPPVLIGGLHLLRATLPQRTCARRALEAGGVRGLWAGHCTGEEAEAAFGQPRGGAPALLKGRLEAGRSWALDLAASAPVSSFFQEVGLAAFQSPHKI